MFIWGPTKYSMSHNFVKKICGSIHLSTHYTLKDSSYSLIKHTR